MERVAVDTTVPLYALGMESRFRTGCRTLIRAGADGQIQLEASIGIVQEVAHVRARRTGDRQDAVRQSERLLTLLTCHPVDVEDIGRALLLFAAHERLDMLDALHAATALNRGIGGIVTADRAFDDVPRLERIDPREAVAMLTP